MRKTCMTLKGSTSEHFSGPCLELAPIGWQLFAPGFSLRDRSAFSLTFGTFATRLLAQPLGHYTELGPPLLQGKPSPAVPFLPRSVLGQPEGSPHLPLEGPYNPL